VISLFHETKIPIVDMKVQMYSKFKENFFWKKMKSLSSMKNGRFHHPKCWEKLPKNGSAVYPFSQNARPILITQNKSKKKYQNYKQKGGQPIVC
jgi:hypothetical protein